MAMLSDQAICLRLRDWSETSQIAVLLTEQYGKVPATAKGAKRRQPSTMAKFSGGLELLTGGQAVLISPKQASLANLIEWDLQEPYWHLRRDWQSYNLALYAVDLVHHMIDDHDPHPRSFGALDHLLRELAEPSVRLSALLVFQWTLIEDLGYLPVLDRDAVSGGPLPSSDRVLAFDPQAGGVTADTGRPGQWRVRRETIELLFAVAVGRLPGSVSAMTVRRANSLLAAYCRQIIHKHLPTMDQLLDSVD